MRWLSAALILILLLPSPALSSDSKSLINEARTSNPEFAFLLLRQVVRDHADTPEACEARFALGEYHFDRQNYASAREEFVVLTTAKKATDIQKFLALNFLKKISEETKNERDARFYTQKTKDVFAKKSFHEFILKKGGRSKWVSALGRTYIFNEEVDRVKIHGDKVYFEVTLP